MSWAFSTQQKVILCCSSTRHRRFIDNLMQVMALPEGGRIRLRYGNKHCDPLVQRMGTEEFRSRDTLVIIAHVRFVDRDGRFLPLRSGKLLEIKTEGSMTYLDVELHDFVQEIQGQSFSDEIGQLATHPLPNNPEGAPAPEGTFCQLLSAPPIMTTASGSILWEKVAEDFLEAIKGSNAEFPFLFHLDILERTSSGTRKVPFSRGLLVAPSISRIEIQMRTLVDKSLFNRFIDRPVGTIEIGVEHPELSLISRNTLQIDTTRNLMTSGISAKLGLRPAYGTITVTSRRGSDLKLETGVDLEDRRLPDEIVIEIPVSVGGRLRRWSAAAALAFAAAAHKFDLRALDSEPYGVVAQAACVFVGVLAALWLGFKPQSGS